MVVDSFIDYGGEKNRQENWKQINVYTWKKDDQTMI